MIRAYFLSLCLTLPCLAQKLAVMETAFGNHGVVNSVELVKQVGFRGIQIHTGNLDKEGVLTLADNSLDSSKRTPSKRSPSSGPTPTKPKSPKTRS